MHYSTVQSMKSAADGHGAFAFFIDLHPQTFGRSSVPTPQNLPPVAKKYPLPERLARGGWGHGHSWN